MNEIFSSLGQRDITEEELTILPYRSQGIQQEKDTFLNYDLESTNIFVEPFEYIRFERTKIMHNRGGTPITQDQHSIWVNKYPYDHDLSQLYYNNHPLHWEDLGFRSLDSTGTLDVKMLQSWNTRIDYVILFRNAHYNRSVFPEQRRQYWYSYKVPYDQHGYYWEQLIITPTNRLEITVRYPASSTIKVWGKQSLYRHFCEIIDPPLEMSANSQHKTVRWMKDKPQVGASYRIDWKIR